MIEARGLTKRFGDKLAVDGLSFAVEPGRITGFLGPNGAGKTTTMRLILGLDRPTHGSVTVNGKDFRQLARPMREVGALLDAKAVHGGRRSPQAVRVRAPQPDALVAAVRRAGASVTATAGNAIVVQGMAADRVGDLAFANGVPLHELTSAQASLEEAFMELTAASVEFHAGEAAPAGAGAVRGDGGAAR